MDAPVLVTISYITDLYFSLNDNIVCKECCTKDEVMSVIKNVLKIAFMCVKEERRIVRKLLCI